MHTALLTKIPQPAGKFRSNQQKKAQQWPTRQNWSSDKRNLLYKTELEHSEFIKYTQKYRLEFRNVRSQSNHIEKQIQLAPLVNSLVGTELEERVKR